MGIHSTLVDDKVVRKQYFIERFLQTLKTNDDFEFHNVPICGLLELSRQYVIMPPGVRELSSEYIKSSINQIIEHTSYLYKSSNQIPVKEMKQLFTVLTLMNELKNTTYIEKVYEVLSSYNCYIGYIKTLQYIINKGIKGNDFDEYMLIDEIIHYIIEYLENRGNTVTEVYAICNNWFRQSPTETVVNFEKIIKHLKEIGTNSLDKLPEVNCQISINYKSEKRSNIEDYLRKILYVLQNENRINRCIFRKYNSKLSISFKLYKIDGLYVDRVLIDISEKILAYIERTKEDLDFTIKKQRKPIEITDKAKLNELKIKHFDNLWKSIDFSNVNDYVYDEMLKLNEWIKIFNNSNDKRTSFLILWSILEFMLVHSVQDNKRA